MGMRLVCLAVCLLTVAGLGVPARAAETGVLRVVLDYPETAAGGAVALHLVAEPAGEDFRLLESFGGGIIRKADAQTPELARWLAEGAGEGQRLQLDGKGCAVYTDLRPGLYLLTQTEAPEGWAYAAPFLVPIPLGDQWQVEARPKTAELVTEAPRTGQHPAPMLGAMGLVLSGTGLYFCLEKLRKK